MAYTQQQIDRIHADRSAKAGFIYAGPNKTLYVGSQLGHLIQESYVNGVAFYWDTQIEPLYELHEGIKTNKEFIRIGSDTAAIGTGTDAFLADVSGGAAEKSYFPSIDFKEIYGLPWGLRLKKGTLDKLIFRVRDNLTGLSTFNIIATGTRI